MTDFFVMYRGVTFKIVETEAATNALPSNVFPIIATPKNNEELALDDLDKIAGGNDFMFVYTANVVGTGLAGAENAAANANKGDGNKKFSDLVKSKLGK